MGRLVHSQIDRVLLVHSAAQGGWLGSFWFIRACPGGCWVHSGSFGLFVRALGVIGFICARLVHSCLFDSFRRALGVVGFIHTLVVYGFIFIRLVHSGTSSESLG